MCRLVLFGLLACAAGRPSLPPLARRGGWLGRNKASAAKAAEAPAEAAAAEAKGAMSEAEIGEMLGVVPVFCLADGEGRPVLMRGANDTEDAAPTQAFFTDADVARAHASRVAQAAGNASLGLQIAALDLRAVLALDAVDRRVAVLPDPRELHVARQLVLRQSGFVHVNATDDAGAKRVDFGDEAAVGAAMAGLDPPRPDLAAGVPLFGVGELDASILGDGVEPWFLSFSDAVRAYVNATGAADAEAAGAGLEKLLSTPGGVRVATLETLLAEIRAPGGGRAFLLPPASSLALLAKARDDAAAPPAEPDAPADEAAALAAAAKSIDSDSGGLFD